MERLAAEEESFLKGYSIKELIPFVERAHEVIPQARVSTRVRWLAEAIEEKPFWASLYRHLAEDGERASVGGVFAREPGSKLVNPENSYTWNQVFSSLDTFLKKFDMRATEFFFRDFCPQNPDPELQRAILLTRTLALRKYPRLRFLRWEDYQQILETPAFWRRLHDDLSVLDEPVSQGRFFEVESHKYPGRGRERIYRFWVSGSRVGRKAYIFDFRSFTQILHEVGKKSPREFLLEYEPQASDAQLVKTIEQTQKLLAEKVLPAKELQSVVKMNKAEFNQTMQDGKFWRRLIADIEDHSRAKQQAYSMSSFLTDYDPAKKEIVFGKPKYYSRLATVYLHSTKGLRRKIAQPMQRLVHYLMWEFKPGKRSLKKRVSEARALCAEMFPHDCLYVTLQTPQFWEAFIKDVQKMQGRHTLAAFLRYFASQNPSCDRRQHIPGKSKYQRLHHRAYHKQEQFLEFLGQLGLNAMDYKEGLAKLFLHTAPRKYREILKEKFPDNYSQKERKNNQRDAFLYEQAKNLLVKMGEEVGKTHVRRFSDREKLNQYRAKLVSAARALKIHVSTAVRENSLEIKIVSRGPMTPKEAAEYEEEIVLLRQMGLSNKAIAERLGLEEHQAGYLVGKLIKDGQVASRTEFPTRRLDLKRTLRKKKQTRVWQKGS